MKGDLFSFISLLSVVGGCSVRSRILQIAAAGGQVTFKPEASEIADYLLIYRFRGPGLATRVTYQLIEPPTGGSYGIADDDYPVALGAENGQISVQFTNADPVNALAIEVYFARFSAAQLADLRCLVGFASPAEAALLQAQLSAAGVTG